MFKIIPVIVLTALLAITAPLFAQQPTQNTIVEEGGIKVSLVQRPQDPSNNHLRFDLVVYSKIDTDRLQIRWNLEGQSEFVEPAGYVNGSRIASSIRAGESKQFSITVRPRLRGNNTLVASAQVVEVQGTRAATARTFYGSLTGGKVIPEHPDQGIVNILKVIYDVFLAVTILYVIAVGIVLAVKSFIKWLKRKQED